MWSAGINQLQQLEKEKLWLVRIIRAVDTVLVIAPSAIPKVVNGGVVWNVERCYHSTTRHPFVVIACGR